MSNGKKILSKKSSVEEEEEIEEEKPKSKAKIITQTKIISPVRKVTAVSKKKEEESEKEEEEVKKEEKCKKISPTCKKTSPGKRIDHPFLDELEKLGYETEAFSEGPHGEYYVFYQTDTDDLEYQKKHPKSKDYQWNFSSMNKINLDSFLECLSCGGHYLNIRIFRNKKDITRENNFKATDLNPELIAYEEEEEEVSELEEEEEKIHKPSKGKTISSKNEEECSKYASDEEKISKSTKRKTPLKKITHPFLDELRKLGYETNQFDPRIGTRVIEDIKGDYYVFYQSDIEELKYQYENRKSINNAWNYSNMDNKFLDSFLGILSCGGHYVNIRIFKREKDITSKYGMQYHNLNPERIIYGDYPGWSSGTYFKRENEVSPVGPADNDEISFDDAWDIITGRINELHAGYMISLKKDLKAATSNKDRKEIQRLIDLYPKLEDIPRFNFKSQKGDAEYAIYNKPKKDPSDDIAIPYYESPSSVQFIFNGNWEKWVDMIEEPEWYDGNNQKKSTYSTKKKNSESESEEEEKEVTSPKTKKKIIIPTKPTTLADQLKASKKVPINVKGKKKKEEEEVEEEVEDTDPWKDVTTYDLDTKDKDINFKKRWRFEPIHKEDMNGRDRLWWMGFDPKNNNWYSGAGITGMVITVTNDEIIPKANRTIQQQTLQEIRQEYVKKERKGYIVPGEEAPELINTMQGYHIKFDKDVLDYPVGVEPKLNGERCLAVKVGDEIIMYSRTKVEWVDARKLFFVKDIALLLKFLPRGVTLDGEMFGEDLSRQQINSMIKDPKKYKDKKQIDKIHFNIFTYADKTTPAETRYVNLVEAYDKYIAAGGNENRIKIVPMVTVNDEEELLEQHRINRQNGGEGSVIYKFANGAKKGHKYETSLYESGKRSGKNSHVFKLKVDISEEGETELNEEEGLILGFYAAKGTQKDAIMFSILDPRGNEFNVGIEGTVASRQELYKKALRNESVVVGKYLEYRYQELSDEGVPQIAVGQNIRDDDDVDIKVIKNFNKLMKERESESESESESEKPAKTVTKEKAKSPKKKEEEAEEIDMDRLNSDSKSKSNPNPYTLKELKVFAKDLKIPKYSTMNKEDLVEAVREYMNELLALYEEEDDE